MLIKTNETEGTLNNFTIFETLANENILIKSKAIK